jgi:hypothetical protein
MPHLVIRARRRLRSGPLVTQARPMHPPRVVRGSITGKDVLMHSLTILWLWGPGVYIRCLRAVVRREPCTFLGVVCSPDPVQRA